MPCAELRSNTKQNRKIPSFRQGLKIISEFISVNVHRIWVQNWVLE